MTVRVQLLTGSKGGVGNASQFKDTFVRANAPGWGPNWGLAPYFSGSTGCNATMSINGNLGRLTQTAVAATQACVMWPFPLTWMLTAPSPVNVFSEMTISASSSIASTSWGPVVGTTGNSTGGGYGISIAALGQISILKFTWTGNLGTGTSSTVLQNTGVTVNFGDVIRTVCTLSAGTWSISAFKNGVQAGVTQTDATLGTTPLMPVMVYSSFSSGMTFDISEFFGGRA